MCTKEDNKHAFIHSVSCTCLASSIFLFPGVNYYNIVCKLYYNIVCKYYFGCFLLGSVSGLVVITMFQVVPLDSFFISKAKLKVLIHIYARKLLRVLSRTKVFVCDIFNPVHVTRHLGINSIAFFSSTIWMSEAYNSNQREHRVLMKAKHRLCKQLDTRQNKGDLNEIL